MLKRIASEFRHHVPFTVFGALTGITIMAMISLFRPFSDDVLHEIFHILHPVHIVLSAIVTTALYRRYGGGLWTAAVIGLVGSVGICSISDTVLPYLGGRLLGAMMDFHLCFIEHPLLIFPGAFLGIGIGLFLQWTKFPHAGHVLVSTWASLFYLIAYGIADWLPLLPLVFLVLFLAVWIPCCTSDIVFPLLFVRKKLPPQNI